MKWIADVLAHFRPPPEARTYLEDRARRERQERDRATLRKADRVIRAYEDLDAALHLEVRKR